MRITAFLALLAAGVVVASASAIVPGIPTIYVEYNPNCTFTLSVDGGTTVTATSPPGPTLPPGGYQIQVLMANPTGGYSCGTPVFTLTGPGVSSTTTFPNESLLDNHVLPALRPSSTYAAEDENAPASTRVYFSTAATGSSASLLSPSTSSSGTAGGSSQGDIVGSAVLPYRGRLAATVASGGRATLTRGGRTVSTLQAGRYDIVVSDLTRTAGFSLEHARDEPVALTGVLYKGRETRRLGLTAGRWKYLSAGKASAFLVK